MNVTINGTAPSDTPVSAFADAHLVVAASGMFFILLGLISLIAFAQSAAWVQAADSSMFSARKKASAAEVVRLFPYLAFLVIFWAW